MRRCFYHADLRQNAVFYNFSRLIIYTKKLLNSDWLRKECRSPVTRVQNLQILQMVSDWLKTQKKSPGTNQILAVLTTILKKMAMVSANKTIIEKLKETLQKPEHVWAKCIENAVLREKYCQ